jgi:hypothetical protein
VKVTIVQMEQIPHAGNLSPPVFSCCPLAAYVPLRATFSESVPAWDFVPVCTKKIYKKFFSITG